MNDIAFWIIAIWLGCGCGVASYCLLTDVYFWKSLQTLSVLAAAFVFVTLIGPLYWPVNSIVRQRSLKAAAQQGGTRLG